MCHIVIDIKYFRKEMHLIVVKSNNLIIGI